MGLCLTPEELENLTDYSQAKRQIEWLMNPPIGEPWKFTIGASGRPKVDREYYQHRQGVDEARKPIRKKVRTEGLSRGTTTQ